jgi:hypothetical protein
VFAAPEAETVAADEGPVVLNWVGLRLKTPGGALYPKPDSRIIQEFNQALNVDLRAVKSGDASPKTMSARRTRCTGFHGLRRHGVALRTNPVLRGRAA